jgi:hypothetical protein
MRVATRLNLTILPAAIGLCTVSALAYWGEFERQAPELFVLLSIVATVGSAVLAWRNTRIISRRVGELAHGFRDLGVAPALPTTSTLDEFDVLDVVRQNVSRLAAAKAELRRSTDARVAAADARVAQSSHVVANVVQLSLKQVEEARLALHILQASPFGELNENQEELIAAARTAMDAADAELRMMTRVVSVSTQAALSTTSVIRLRSLLDIPLAMAMGGAQEVRESVRLPNVDELPAVAVDVPAVQEALALLFRDCVAAHPPGEPLIISGSHTPPSITLNIPMDTSAYVGAPPLRFHLANALLHSSGVALGVDNGSITLQLPVAV